MKNMKTKINLMVLLALAFTVPIATLMVAAQVGARPQWPGPRPRGRLRRLCRRRHRPAWRRLAPHCQPSSPPTPARCTKVMRPVGWQDAGYRCRIAVCR